MRRLDIRQLYGPNRFLHGPAIQVMVSPEGEPPSRVAEALSFAVREGARELGWPAPEVRTLVKPEVVTVCFSARWLESAWELGRAAIEAAAATLAEKPYLWDKEEILRSLEEEKPKGRLKEIYEEAKARDIPILTLENGDVLLGQGKKSLRFSPQHPPSSIPWERLGRIPLLVITGTNGKTTCTRLLARMFTRAGRVAGNTSSDGIQVDGAFVLEGDCTGPDSMRNVLAHPQVEVAVLEAARGGIVRRGLPFDRCDLALVTNITPDHLGLGGVDTLDEMAEVKGAVVRALGAEGVAVLSADDARVAALSRPERRTVYFSQNPSSPVFAAHLAGGGSGAAVDKDTLRVFGFSGGSMPLEEIPITLGGAARHNAENAAAVAAAGLSFGLPWEDVKAALAGFFPTPEDNPGRLNMFSFRGATVFLDFAHNVDGIRALVETARKLPAKRRILLIGQAGDRGDDLLREEAREAFLACPDVIVIKETPEQLRGRAPGEVPRVFHQAFLALGAKESSIRHEPTELDGVKRALSEAQPGDQVLLMVHLVRAEALALLRAG